MRKELSDLQRRAKDFFVYSTAWDMGDDPEPHIVRLREKLSADWDLMVSEIEHKAAEKVYEQGVIDGKRSSELYSRYQSGDLSEREYLRLMAATNLRAESYRQEREGQ